MSETGAEFHWLTMSARLMGCNSYQLGQAKDRCR